MVYISLHFLFGVDVIIVAVISFKFPFWYFFFFHSGFFLPNMVMVGWLVGQMDGWMDGQMDGWSFLGVEM